MIPVRLVLLAVVLGIALMHHLGGMQHGGPSDCAMAGASTSMTMPAHDPGAPRHTDTTDNPDVGGMLHLCLAVLGAMATALVLVVLGVLDPPVGTRRATHRPAGDGHSRAPPGSRRLAQLQILRI